jgi:hypothetical protein
MQLSQQVKARIAASSTAAVLALGAMADAGAVFAVPTEITDAATNVGLVGAAVFTVMVGIKLYKWLRRAL